MPEYSAVRSMTANLVSLANVLLGEAKRRRPSLVLLWKKLRNLHLIAIVELYTYECRVFVQSVFVLFCVRLASISIVVLRCIPEEEANFATNAGYCDSGGRKFVHSPSYR